MYNNLVIKTQTWNAFKNSYRNGKNVVDNKNIKNNREKKKLTQWFRTLDQCVGKKNV